MDCKYLTGLCPECGEVFVGREGDDAVCPGCRTPLILVTTCGDNSELAFAIDRLTEFEQVHGLYKECFRQSGERMHRFIVIPSPFPVYVRGMDMGDAASALSRKFEEHAIEGFTSALARGRIGFHIVPVSEDAEGIYTYDAGDSDE